MRLRPLAECGRRAAVARALFVPAYHFAYGHDDASRPYTTILVRIMWYTRYTVRGSDRTTTCKKHVHGSALLIASVCSSLTPRPEQTAVLTARDVGKYPCSRGL